MIFFAFLLSPTRAGAKRLKKAGLIRDASTLCVWNTVFQAVALVFAVVTSSAYYCDFHLGWWIYLLPAALAFSRVNELVFAFYGDALDRVKGELPRLPVQPSQRVGLLIAGYLETILQFGIFHLAIQQVLDQKAYSQHFNSALDSVYFSGVTMTTTGFGDFSPVNEFARYTTLYETLVGILFLTMALSVYLSSEQDAKKPVVPFGKKDR